MINVSIDKINRIKELVELLNKACDAYYNTDKLLMSDFEYDKLFDELQQLENETGFILNISPTQRPGYEVQDDLKKVTHQYPMLSLDKTKSVKDLISFIGDKYGLIMFKMDGLSACVTYDNDGILIRCETRGNGIEGIDITENAKTFVNLPKKINHKGGLVVFGECIIDYPTFYRVNEKLPEDKKYKNPRNLVAGSVQVLDSKICAERGVRFIAWRLVDGYNENSFCKRLEYLSTLGFEVVPYISMKTTKEEIEKQIEDGRNKANELGFPIDGMVISFDDTNYLLSKGATSHHLRGQIAWKATEDREITTLREIEWSPSRSGQLNPVAIFDTIELAGTEVSRASLSNISVMEQYNIKIGAQVEVSKRNEIIPKVESCDGNGTDVIIPDKCPVCGATTEIRINDNVKVLYCTSESCPAKLLGKLELFCGKEGMDIDGLSTSQLQTFIDKGWLKDISDIYNLHLHETQMQHMKGFGKRSVTKLINAINKSRTVTMANFIRALGIPLIGKTQSKALSDYYDGNIDKFETGILKEVDFNNFIEGFGEKRNQSIYDWFGDETNFKIYNKLKKELTFIVTDGFMNKPEGEDNMSENNNNNYKDLSGHVYVITGSLNHFANRDELKSLLESSGAKVSGSISKKTTALICNSSDSGSTKSRKAAELGIPVWTEDELLNNIKVS